MGNYTIFRFRYRMWFFAVVIGVGLMLPTVGTSHADSRIWNDLVSQVSVLRLSVQEPVSPSPLRREFEERKKTVEIARAAFDKAKEAGAEYASPYEYYMAQEYLELAQEELNQGDRDGVLRFASKSVQYSMFAIRKSSGGGN
ncbi:MAG: DUF4398 domain-containing protein [Deltaproteobacteria bacterium]|nr:DUF4398 domain-containing protein [Deltaproteobacteria bacterium]